jgi:hypothetical protein
MKKLLFLLGFSFLVFSCQKSENPTQVDPEQQLSQVVSEDDAQSENSFSLIFDDVMGTSDEVGNFGSGVFGKENGLDTLSRCFQMTVEHPAFPLPFPVVVTITYPPTGCVGRDGRVRRGQIRTEYTNRLIIPNAQSTTTFINYSVDSVSIRGTYLVKNTTGIIPGNLNPRFLIKVTGGRLGYPNGNVVEWGGEKVIEQIEGLSTPVPVDDIFKITGSASGARIESGRVTQWTSQIIEPLIKRFNCFWIVKGTIKTTRTTLSTNSPWISILDFGQGNCDNIATLTINGQTTTIHLR